MERRWETASRYYAARLERDLLGDVVLVRINGGRHNRIGKIKTCYMPSWEAGLGALDDIARLREAHHYTEVKLRPVASAA